MLVRRNVCPFCKCVSHEALPWCLKIASCCIIPHWNFVFRFGTTIFFSKNKFSYFNEIRTKYLKLSFSRHILTYLLTDWLTYLLTYTVVQSPSWEANWFAASQEIPRISRNTKVHYRTHKRPPPVSILGQPNPVHIRTSHLLEIQPNIIHPSTPRSPQWSLSLRFPHQDPIHPPVHTHTRHMPSPSHSSRFYFLGI